MFEASVGVCILCHVDHRQQVKIVDSTAAALHHDVNWATDTTVRRIIIMDHISISSREAIHRDDVAVVRVH